MKIKPIIFGTILMLAGCAGQNPVGESTMKVEDIRKSGFLQDYSILKEGGEDRMNLVYVNPKANFYQYSKIMVDPVTIWLTAGSNLSKVPPKERQLMANELHDLIVKAFQKDFEIVRTPEPGTMRFRVALVDAKKSSPFLIPSQRMYLRRV